MVQFVNVPHLTNWVADTGPERILAELTDAMEREFRRWPEFDKTPRVPSHSPDGVIELMPTSDGVEYGFKYVNGHPINTGRGLQTVTGFGVLADVATGYPILFAEMTVLTALRTAATSAMVARHLAPRGSSTMAMIGSGAQAEFQALAMRSALGINKLRVFDVDSAAMAKFHRNATSLGFDVTLAENAADAVRGTHVITTCTADKRNATVLSAQMVREGISGGVHLNAIGGDCPGKTELDLDLVREATVFVEHPEQTFIEGEIQRLPEDWPVREFWQVLSGETPGRTSGSEITLFDSVGFAIEDFTALRYLHRSIQGTGYFEILDLVAEPDDPKNLFGLIPSRRPAAV